MPPKKQQAKEGRFQTSESKSPAFVKLWAREARSKEVCSQSVMTSVERKDQPQSLQLKRCTRDSAVWIHTVALKLLYQPTQPWLNIPCVFFFFRCLLESTSRAKEPRIAASDFHQALRFTPEKAAKSPLGEPISLLDSR